LYRIECALHDNSNNLVTEPLAALREKLSLKGENNLINKAA